MVIVSGDIGLKIIGRVLGGSGGALPSIASWSKCPIF